MDLHFITRTAAPPLKSRDRCVGEGTGGRAPGDLSSCISRRLHGGRRRFGRRPFPSLLISRPALAVVAAESGGIRVHSLRPTTALAMSVSRRRRGRIRGLQHHRRCRRRRPAGRTDGRRTPSRSHYDLPCAGLHSRTDGGSSDAKSKRRNAAKAQ